MLNERFPRFHFRPPATEAAIRQAEAKLKIRLPDELRTLYLESDGFREHVGNSKYLLSLMDEDMIGSLVTITKAHWGGIFGFSSKKFRPYVFFGVSAANYAWGINISGPTHVIRYRHDMEGEYESVGNNIMDIYAEDLLRYPSEA
jgi:hypothetical protein